MDLSNSEFVAHYFNQSLEALSAFALSCSGVVINCAELILTAFRQGRKLMIAGNGGSAADAQHIAGEFISRLFVDHTPLPTIALTTDTSVLTAVGNDFAFEKIFERQIIALCIEGDVFLGISTSGRSQNVISALQAARARGVKTIGFTGSHDGPMTDLCDVLLRAPSGTTTLIQQVHMVAAHMICALVEAEMFGRRGRI